MAQEWNIVLIKDAEKDLHRLDRKTYLHVRKKLEWLENNFDQITPLPLGNEWSGFFKLRVGDYRVIYKIHWDEKFLVVAHVEHRSKVYEI